MSHSSLARIRRHLQPSTPVNIFTNTYTSSHQQPQKLSLLNEKSDNDTLLCCASAPVRGGSNQTPHSLLLNFNQLHNSQFPLQNIHALGDRALQTAEINDLIHTPLDEDHIFESWRHVREQQYQYEQQQLQGKQQQEKYPPNQGPNQHPEHEQTTPPEIQPQVQTNQYCPPRILDHPSPTTMIQEAPMVADNVDPDCLRENAEGSRSTAEVTSFCEDSCCTSCGYSCSQSDRTNKIYDYASSSMTVTSAASSTWEGHEHDFDKQATISVQEMLEELEAYLYKEKEDSPGQNISLVVECQEWSTLFPHLRVKGCQLIPPIEIGYEVIPHEEARCHSPYFFLPYVKPGAYKAPESASPTNRDRTIPFSAGFYGGMQRAPSPPRTPPSSPPLSRRTGTSDLNIMICGIKLPDQAMKKIKVRNKELKEGDTKTKADKKKIKNVKTSYNIDADINLKHGVWSYFDWSDETLNEALRKFWNSKTDTKKGDGPLLLEPRWVVIGHFLSQNSTSEPILNVQQKDDSPSPSPSPDLDGPRCTTPTRKNPHTLLQPNASKKLPKGFSANVPPEYQNRPVVELIAEGEGGLDALNEFAVESASTRTDNVEQWEGYVRFGIVLIPRPGDILKSSELDTLRRNIGFPAFPLVENYGSTVVIVDMNQQESGKEQQGISVKLSDDDIFLALQEIPNEICSISLLELSNILSESGDKISASAKIAKKLNLIRSEIPTPTTLEFGDKDGEEIWACHGVLDEWFAVDKSSEDFDNLDRLDVNARRKGFPPLTPSANVRQAVLDHIFDDVWAEVIPILQPLIQTVIGEGGMPFDISDSNELRKASKVEVLRRRLMDEGDATNYQPILDSINRERLLSAMTIRPVPLQKRREASANARRGSGGDEFVNDLQQPAVAYGLPENVSQQQGYLRAQTAGGQSNNGPSTGPFLQERRNISGSAWKRYSATASRLTPLVPVASSNTAASITNANQLSDVLFGTSIGPIKNGIQNASRPSTSHGKRLPPIRGNPNQDTGQHPVTDGPFAGSSVDGGSNLNSTPLAFIPSILNTANTTMKAGRHVFFDASDAAGISQDFDRGRLRSETPRLISSARRQLSSANTRGRSSYGYSRPHTAFTNIDETIGISKTSTPRTVNGYAFNTRNSHLGSMCSSLNDVTSTSLASISSTGESDYRLYHEMDPCSGMKDRSISPVFGMGIKTMAGNDTNKYPLAGHRKAGHAHY